MRSALSSVDGVHDVKIDFGKKTATVTCDKGTSEEALVEALAATDRFSGKVQ